MKWEEETMKRYETWKQERSRLYVHVFITGMSQIMLIVFLFQGASIEFNMNDIVMKNMNLNLLLAKGICGVVLHLAMQSNMTQGNEMMKYALNHHMRFLNYSNAFFIGVGRSMITLLTETISLVIVF